MKTPGIIDGNITSGIRKTYWTETQTPLQYQTLNSDKQTEVLVIGGGIAGLTAAYCLAQSGKKVILLEDGCLGSGETGRTTAQISYALDDRYYELEKLFGTEKAKLIAQSHVQALQWIEQAVGKHNIDCNFVKVPGFLFPHPSDTEDNLMKEFSSTQNIGLPTKIRMQIPGIEENSQRCIEFPGQGQFHVLKYLKGLADAIIEMGGEIYTHTHADDVTDDGATANGYTVTAQHVVVATNSPVNNRFTLHSKQFAYRSYVIGAKIPKGTLPYAMWWDTGDQDSKWVAKPYHYVRLEPFDDEYDLLISGGEDHKTGQAGEEDIPEEARYANLVAWTKSYFPYFDDVAYQWSGQVLEPADGIAFIGKNPGDKDIYVITGDSGNGMTHGTLGGLIINDIIMGKENPYIPIYDPSRITLKAATDYAAEVGNMAYEAVKDWVKGSEVDDAEKLQPGQGAVIASGLKKIAAYRDEQGTLHTCSAVCPHLGGVLQWNNDEKSFDCPLHGSRFTATGGVINGPAITNLKEAGS